jgi:uncharacterized protein YbaP (TraB family)
MPYINIEYFTVLSKQSEATPANLKIKDPMLFEIEIHGRKSYILGTHHATPLCRLPKECIDLIAKCKKLYVEEQLPTQIERTAYKDYFAYLFRKTSGDDWYQKISAKHQELVERYFQECLIRKFGPEFVSNIKVSDVCFNIVMEFLTIDFQKELYPLLEHIKDENQAIEESGSMDNQLQDLFTEVAGGLEPYSHHELLLAQDAYDEDKLDEMKLFLEITPRLKILNKIGDIDRTFKYIQDKYPEAYQSLLEASQEHCDYYLEGAYLKNYRITQEYDSGEAGYSAFMNVSRNNIYFRNILRYAQTVETPLFAFGAMHLLGENGVLSMLKQNGIAIKNIVVERILLYPTIIFI